MATKLQLYNTALRYCKETALASLTESREPRRLLDEVYDAGGIDDCLEDAMWKFATRSVKIDYDTSFTSNYGFTYVFTKPSDWILTVAMCSDEFYDAPLTRYHHENDEWYADLDILYVRYVSNATTYGYDLSLWPTSFFRYVAAAFAWEIVDKLTGDQETIDNVEKRLDKNKSKAKNRDAWNQPQAFPATGLWVSSRQSGRGTNSWRDRGNRNSLLG